MNNKKILCLSTFLCLVVLLGTAQTSLAEKKPVVVESSVTETTGSAGSNNSITIEESDITEKTLQEVKEKLDPEKETAQENPLIEAEN